MTGDKSAAMPLSQAIEHYAGKMSDPMKVNALSGCLEEAIIIVLAKANELEQQKKYSLAERYYEQIASWRKVIALSSTI